MLEVSNVPDAFMVGDVAVGEADVVGPELVAAVLVGAGVADAGLPDSEADGLAVAAKAGGRETLPVGFPARWTGADSALAHTTSTSNTTTPAAIANANREVNQCGGRSRGRVGRGTPSP